MDHLTIDIIASIAVVVIVGWLAAWRWRSWRELDGVAMRYVREQEQAAIKRDAQMRVLADELQLARRDTAKTDAQIAELKSGYIQHTRLTDCCISELYARVDALETLPAVDAEGKPNPHLGGLIADVRHRLEAIERRQYYDRVALEALTAAVSGGDLTELRKALDAIPQKPMTPAELLRHTEYEVVRGPLGLGFDIHRKIDRGDPITGEDMREAQGASE